MLAYLKRRHVGREKAISSRALEARFCVCGATVRRAVLRLRRMGEAICSDPCGYYYAQSGAELWDTIGRMERRVIGSAQVTRRLRKAARHIPGNGQTRLPK
jgi:hypothetical protein